MRGNKIEQIGTGEEGAELPELPSLEYLNLRSNKLEKMEDAFKLFAYANLEDLNLINNPCELSFSSMNIMIGRMLIKGQTGETKHTKLKRFCKVKITDVHRLESVFLAQYEWEKAEAKRKADEEEAARLEAEAAAAE